MVGRCGLQVFKGLVSVGPLLAVLMSLQQGECSVRSFNTRETPDFLHDFAGLQRFLDVSGAVTGRPAAPAQRPNTAPARSMVGVNRWCRLMIAAGLPCRFVNAAIDLNLGPP